MNGEDTCGFGLLKTKEENPFVELKDIDFFHVHIICRDGVLLVDEGHTTSVFLLCTSLLDEEADKFGKVIVLLLLKLTVELCCRTQYVQSFKWLHRFRLVNLLKKHVKGNLHCTLTTAQLRALTLSS